MYSGNVLTNFSGNIIGTHQKINRAALRRLADLTPVKHFPSNKLLLHFEGKNGPDGIKAKSPGQNELMHFYDPFDPEDQELPEIIQDHYKNLVSELRNNNMERAAFEATWLSHAIVDGLTPAHHHPYEEELATLRMGEGNETRVTIKDKLSIKGDTKKETIKNNWKMWGVKGLLTTHGFFEAGVASIVALKTYNNVPVTRSDINHVKEQGLDEHFKRMAREIALLNLYEDFYKYGWTTKLAKKVDKELMPRIIKTVTSAWYLALREAGLASRNK